MVPVSRRFLFIHYLFFLTFIEGYCLICVNCGFHFLASKEALAYMTDKNSKFVPVTMGYIIHGT